MRSWLQQVVFGVSFLLALVSCRDMKDSGAADVASASLAPGPWPQDSSPNLSSLANSSLIRVGQLRENQLVVTIDESPHVEDEVDWTARLAESLKSGAIQAEAGTAVQALFFLVGNRLAISDAAYTLPGANSNSLSVNSRSANFRAGTLTPLLQNGHFVANHSFSHPVGGVRHATFNPAGRGYDGLMSSRSATERQQAFRELIWTHTLIHEALRTTGADSSRYLRLFRPSGGSWAGLAEAQALHAQVAPVARNYGGPVGWTIPERGRRADWECFRTLRAGITESELRTHARDCVAQNYTPGLQGARFKGLVLFHGNLIFQATVPAANGVRASNKKVSYSEFVVEEFVRQTKAQNSNVRFVSPTCFVSRC